MADHERTINNYIANHEMKTTSLTTQFGEINLSVPCTLKELKNAFGENSVLYLKKGNGEVATFVNNDYVLQQDQQYILRPAPDLGPQVPPSVNDIMTLKYLHDLFANNKAHEDLEKKMRNILTGIESLPEAQRKKVTTNSVNSCLHSLREIRANEQDQSPQLHKIDSILLPLMQIQRKILTDPEFDIMKIPSLSKHE